MVGIALGELGAERRQQLADRSAGSATPITTITMG
jgi:hypothetical protein